MQKAIFPISYHSKVELSDKIVGYFTQDYIDFFDDLRFNNSKTWFGENRSRYQKFVKKPFEDFIKEIILKVSEFDPEIHISPKASIFRINRDIRFTKDKTPYKTHMAASISRNKRKEEDFAGYYVHVSPFEVYVGGGVYFTNSKRLRSIRRFIVDQPDKFESIVYDSEFHETFGEIRGDRLKRLPKELRIIADRIPEVANKQFYFMKELDPLILLSDNFADIVVSLCQKAYPFNSLLREAIQYGS